MDRAAGFLALVSPAVHPFAWRTPAHVYRGSGGASAPAVTPEGGPRVAVSFLRTQPCRPPSRCTRTAPPSPAVPGCRPCRPGSFLLGSLGLGPRGAQGLLVGLGLSVARCRPDRPSKIPNLSPGTPSLPPHLNLRGLDRLCWGPLEPHLSGPVLWLRDSAPWPSLRGAATPLWASRPLVGPCVRTLWLHYSHPCVSGSLGPVEAGEAGKEGRVLGSDQQSCPRTLGTACTPGHRGCPAIAPCPERSCLDWGAGRSLSGGSRGLHPCGARLQGLQSGLLCLLLCHHGVCPRLLSGPGHLQGCSTREG